jgi:hypothetical protein
MTVRVRMPELNRPAIKGDNVRCPHCQTLRLKVLPKIDRIEKLYGNTLMNRIRARRGDTIYHCVYCRMQFYNPRKPVGRPTAMADNPGSGKTEPEPGTKFTAAT